ncbi:MAG: hypothetical protein COU25_01030 [Candidatus Levybacteria bacterium CG10_big_fil_rev_8_21_14_0_10_35_13]|nr:MAG: hypothetical protein COU25_01030 [Candidatus Levybacteria bacterium CG10_big_fil_rev_8_21_14_0_10_35_13]
MSQADETFFTSVGCMDGRVQEVIAKYGRQKFNAKYPDTITEAGFVGLLANNPSPQLLESIKNKVLISTEKHHSKGVIVHGHQECAALDAVDDSTHRQEVRESVRIIKNLINDKVPVVGVFVKRSNDNSKDWIVEEL